HNGSLANGDKGRRRSRLALYKRPKANGVKPDVIHNVSTPLVSKALSNKSQHSISYTLSRSHSVIVEYTHDSNTDIHIYTHIFDYIHDTTPPYSTLLHTTPHYSTLLHPTPHYSTLLHPTPPYSTLLHPTPPYSTLLHPTPHYSTLLHTAPPYSTLLHLTPYYSTLLHTTPPYSTLLHTTPPYSTLLHPTPHYSTLLHTTPPYSTLLHPTPHYSTLLHTTPPYSTLLHPTPHYSTLLRTTPPYSTLLHPTPHYSTLLHPTTHYSTLLHTTTTYSTLLHPAPPYSTLLHTAPPYSTLLHPTPYYSTLLHTAPPYSTLLHTAPHYSTLLHPTPHYSTLLHTAPHYSTLLHTAPPYSTLLHTTPPYSTLLHTTPHCSTLLHTAPHYFTLLHTTPLCSAVLYSIGRSTESMIDFVVTDTAGCSTSGGGGQGQGGGGGGGQSAQSTISRYACRIMCERSAPYTARIYAAGFDSSKNIFLGVSHHGDDYSPAPGVWREISVCGNVFALRETRSAQQRGKLVENESNTLQDGSLIDLCGATLLWRTPSGLRRTPTLKQLETLRQELNAARPQCPVGFNTLAFPSLAQREIVDKKQPWVYVNCGHVHGYHNWGYRKDKGHNVGPGGTAPASTGERECPMCRCVGPYVPLWLGCEGGLYLDAGPPTHAFCPCGHVCSEKTVAGWSQIPLPHGTHAFHAACPFCGTWLTGEQGHIKLIFQGPVD
ncbi:unnamed protein product, partial [Coregonus sp. 'balchen']